MSKDEDSDYTVGYGRPPIHTRFKKGQSGNPSGRRAATKRLDWAIEEELDSLIPAMDDGRRVLISKGGAVIMQLGKKALSGNPSAFETVLQYSRVTDPVEQRSAVIIKTAKRK